MSTNFTWSLMPGIIAAAVAAVSMPAHAQQKIVLSIADALPVKHVTSVEGASFFMKRATELSNARIEFKYFPAEQLAKASGLLQAIQTGVVDGGPVIPAYTSDKMPLAGVTMLPGLTSSATQGAVGLSRALQSGPLHEEFVRNGVTPVFTQMFPPYQVINRSKPLRQLADFSGKKLRSAGGSMSLMVKSLGAVPISITAPDMYLAMERGTIDGLFLSLSSIKAYNLQEVAKSVSLNGPFGTTATIYAFNSKRFDALPKDLQQVLLQAGEETTKHLAQIIDAQVGDAKSLLKQAGVELYSFSDTELAEIQSHVASVAQDWVVRMKERNLPAEQALADFRKALVTR